MASSAPASPLVGADPTAPIQVPEGVLRTSSWSAGVFAVGDTRNFTSPTSSEGLSSPVVQHISRKGTLAQQVLQAVVYGLINAVVLVPIMVGFAQIIFQDPFFAPHRPLLVKLVLFSAILHQTVFTLSSSMPFAIGQVQDAGLIFLSTMASSIVALTKNELSEEDVLSTTLFSLAIATALLGVALWITGRCQLASLVQYLPMPVVGGYLAFIGLYCGQAGLSLMTGLQIQGVQDWPNLFHREPMTLLLPGLATGIFMYLAIRQFRHFAVLPTMLLVIPIMFYIVLFASGSNLQEARANKWLDSDTTEISFWNIWKLFKPSGFALRVLPYQAVPWLGMYFVVAFSSCLDVAAIQADLGRQLDFNHELKTVGISNIVSGTMGGFTGSYIFSQTIFAMRVGVRDRKAACVVILCEIIMFLLPYSILAFVPALFFGGILTFIAVDLLVDWLVESRHKFASMEYFIVWVSFTAILFTGLETGMILGTIFTALIFVFHYAVSGTQIKAVHPRSHILRSIKHRQILKQNDSKIKALRISGHVFFGSAVRIFEEVKNVICRWEGDADDQLSRSQSLLQSMNTIFASGGEADAALASNLLSRAETALETDALPLPSYVILDFGHVTGLDATSCTTCFQPLVQVAQEKNIVVVIAGAKQEVLDLLKRQAVLPKPEVMPDLEENMSPASVMLFGTLEESVGWCEDHLIKNSEARLSPTGCSRPSSMQRVLADAAGLEEINIGAELCFAEVEKKKGEVIFQVGAESSEMYVVKAGVVELQNTGGTRFIRCLHGTFVGDMDFILEREHSFTAVALEDTKLWCLKRSEVRRMLDEEPRSGASLQLALCRGLALAVHEVLIDGKALVETDSVMGS